MNMRPTIQIHSNYTEHDFLVWETLFNRQINILKPIVSSSYLDALEILKFSADKIPNFDEIAEILKPLTGWSIEVVPNISPQKVFFEFLSQKKFTATCWLRTIEQLDYLEEPDMFHDVFAHVPLLCNQPYVDFFNGLSTIALQYIDNTRVIELLGRIYWFTIEFGLIKENDELKIYGAGIISSMSETKHCLSDNATYIDFDVQTIFNTDYMVDMLQEKYFVIKSFQQLFDSLSEIEELIELVIKKN